MHPLATAPAAQIAAFIHASTNPAELDSLALTLAERARTPKLAFRAKRRSAALKAAATRKTRLAAPPPPAAGVLAYIVTPRGMLEQRFADAIAAQAFATAELAKLQRGRRAGQAIGRDTPLPTTTRGQAVTTAGALSDALALLILAAERSGSIPVLGCVHLAADGAGGLRGTTTNMEHGMTLSIPGQAAPDFVAVLALATLRAAIKGAARAEAVTLTASGDATTLHVQGHEARLTSLPAADFPTYRTATTAAFPMRASMFLQALKALETAVSTEETRFYLNGIHICPAEGDDTTLRLEATDGHVMRRVMLRDGDYSGWPAINKGSGSILPRLAIAPLRKVLTAAGDDIITLRVGPLRLECLAAGVEFGTKLIDGTFPEVSRVIPRADAVTMEFDAAELAQACRAAMAQSPGRGTPIRLEAVDGSLVAEASNLQGEVIRHRLAAATTTAPMGFATGFQARYLASAIKALPEGARRLHVSMGCASSPARIEAVGQADWICVIMPMRA